MGGGSIGIFQMVSNSGLMVQFVLLVLCFFSLVSWSIIILKILHFRKASAQSQSFIEAFWKCRDLSDAKMRSKEFLPSPIVYIFNAGYAELKKVCEAKTARNASADSGCTTLDQQFSGMDNITRSLQKANSIEIKKMRKMVPFLATVGNVTPFVGLFGTVWGIMNSFHGIGLRGSASLAVVAPGISEALVATAFGLAVAIPAVIAFNYFSNQILEASSDMESFSSDFLNIIERDILIPNKE